MKSNYKYSTVNLCDNLKPLDKPVYAQVLTRGPAYRSFRTLEEKATAWFIAAEYPTNPHTNLKDKLERKYDIFSRDDKFKDFTNPFTRYCQQGSLDLFYGENPDIKLFEVAISEFTLPELACREKYATRRIQLEDIAKRQIQSSANNKRNLSAGMQQLLEIANGYVGMLTVNDLAKYKAKGCDIDLSLLQKRAWFGANSLDESRLFSDCSSQNRFSNVSGQSVIEGSKDAFFVIQAFMSIAEFERFGGDGHHLANGIPTITKAEYSPVRNFMT